MLANIDKIDPKKNILIKGAKLHNLKNIDVCIPRNELVVITGLSGSGKSSLAFDTLYAEGQRRYVESLSSYARQFLGRLNKPEVDYIKGIAPAIAIEQKVNSKNPRSTVGTSTEIYDYLKLLFARIGHTYSPISGGKVKKHEVYDVVDFMKSQAVGERYYILSPLHHPDREVNDQLNVLLQQGYARVKAGGEVVRIETLLEINHQYKNEDIKVVIDRLKIDVLDEETLKRIADSVQTAFFEGRGVCEIEKVSDGETFYFSNRFELDGILFEETNEYLFAFNNPYGACKVCEGYGSTIGIDPELVIPDQNLSIYEDAIACWKGETHGKWKDMLVYQTEALAIPIHKPYHELTEAQQKIVWEGKADFPGISGFFNMIEQKNYKIQNRVLLSRYRGRTTCAECDGKRLRKEASYVKVYNKSIVDLVDVPIDELHDFFQSIVLNEHDEQVAKRLLIEIKNRVRFLLDVGLGYLTLNRRSSTLSGGESQRINLATSLGSSLVGSMYILDEPSIGLHSKDTERLVHVLKSLQKLGNTVIVVEHDEDIMRAADRIIDIGPEAGSHGGEVIFTGPIEEINSEKKSLTAQYLNGTKEISVPKTRRKWDQAITIEGARENNLKNIDVQIPLGVLTAISGLSGSGKSTLIRSILYPALSRLLGNYGNKPGQFNRLSGDLEAISSLEFVDQNPIGKSSRSNPVTYLKAYDDIRALYASLELSKARGYKTKHFSFNVEGGRCDQCDGEGSETIEMQFMADVQLVCEACNGKRFKREVLEIKFHDKNITDILELTVDDAILFFEEFEQKKIVNKLKPLQDVGLGYVQLGQSSSTLSGGEAQRIKLASFLGKGRSQGQTLFIFDEPTTGLHFHDIKKLLLSFEALIQKGHSVLVIEHNLDVIKCADWIIDLGKEGGKSGGQLIFEGTPENLIKCKDSHTATYLKDKL